MSSTLVNRQSLRYAEVAMCVLLGLIQWEALSIVLLPQVTMDNLNDNINLEFLSNKLQKFGEWDSLAIDYHPVTKKHLGLARVMFKLVGSAVACVAALHGRSMMGKQVGGNFFFSMHVISFSR